MQMPRNQTPHSPSGINSVEFPPAETSDATRTATANPYRRLFHSNSKGFEYGEDRRLGQLLFYFDEKPETDVIDKLKQHGYRWHPADKSWRVQASATSRVQASRIANEIHGEAQKVSR
jgi:arginyl-tRNA--protein-N-Asp/Glu arginylyltransferase